MSSSSESSTREVINTTNNNTVEENNLYRALWEECAGKLFYVPKEGDEVVYFVQPHIDEVRSYAEPVALVDVPPNIPAAIHCVVLHVQLKADRETDEVVAHVTLVPKQEGDEASSKRPPPDEQSNDGDSETGPEEICVLTKPLTHSDVTTHGGYTIPKAQALKMLPFLDASRGHAKQDVAMYDLHGKKWTFRHTLRGTPRRHLLSTGWSSFLYAKQLIQGDTLVYLRSKSGGYRIGVRRSRKSTMRTAALPSIVSGQSLQFGVVATVIHALQTRTMFSVYCRPWRNRSSFLVPLQQYLDSFKYDYSVGERFWISYENDECVEQRFTGRIDGTEDLDPVRWPGSKWKCLKVTMDNDPTNVDCPMPERVSPWEIELIPSYKRKGEDDAPPFDQKKLFRSNLLGFQGGFSTAGSAGQSSSQGFRPCTPTVEPSPGFGLLYNSNLANDTEPKFKSFTLFGKNIVGIPSEELPSQANANQHTPTPPSDIQSTSRQHELAFNDKGCYIQAIKYNSAIMDSRFINLSGMSGYNDLIRELDAKFGFSGSLINGSSGWYMTYLDAYGKVVRVGDRTWNEFVLTVIKIDIRAKAHHSGIRIA